MSAEDVVRSRPDPANSAQDRRPLLEAVDVTKHFRVRSGRVGRAIVHAAENVSVALYPGTVTAIVGESGSGKSTLSRMLARTQKLTAGKLYFQGEEISLRKRASAEYRRSVQLVLQDPFASLNPVHNVRYILSRPLVIHGRGGDNLEESILGLLRRVSLEPAEQFINKYPHELSGGQRQRVSIARGLAVQPKVLLADEPVSMLDVSIRLGVLNLLADLRDRERLAILYVTHDIASARYLADTIMVMYAGRVVEVGPADRIANAPAHPYTQLLLSAAPDPETDEKPWVGAAGTPPSLVRPPSGCRFHPRCPYAMPICSAELPPSFPVSGTHTAACWLHSPAATDPASSGDTASFMEGPPVDEGN
ncbi:MAG: peptide/nickel transport system ATP-binding protein [Actinomycetota bacterium]|nr:peptide/nickel transport system ATP-binding protein [Actinomycetota bacterium]